MSKAKVYHCKVGTIPASIIIKGRPKIQEDSRINFRYTRDDSSTTRLGKIDKVNDDGYFFVALI
jgi:hypothetical protein